MKRSVIVASLYECEQLCLQESQFQCLTFNFMPKFVASLPANCELSDINYRNIDLTNPSLLSISEDHDFYGRDLSRSLDACIDGTFIHSTKRLLNFFYIFYRQITLRIVGYH